MVTSRLRYMYSKSQCRKDTGKNAQFKTEGNDIFGDSKGVSEMDGGFV